MPNKQPEGFKEVEHTAAEYAKDHLKVRILLEEAWKKANQNRPALLKVWHNMEGLLLMLKGWMQGHYKKVPWKTLVYGIASLVYFVNPFDVVPDFIPVTGLLDDATLIAFVLRSIKGDIEEFRQWEESRKILSQAQE